MIISGSRKTVLLASLLGLVSLGLQFLFNRLIFFYIINTDYATVSVISLHLTGFLIGALVAQRLKYFSAAHALSVLPLLISIAYLLIWRIGLDVFPIMALLILLGFFAFLIAFFGGFIIASLLARQDSQISANCILIADTAGSVAGALITGFWLLPDSGLDKSFLIFISLSLVLALIQSELRAKPFFIMLVIAPLLVMWPSQFFRPANAVLRVNGYPLANRPVASIDLLSNKESRYGVISVIQNKNKTYRQLSLDNMPLCGANPDGSDLETYSEWEIGRFSARLVADKIPTPRVAIVGLGCGFTLTAVLRNLPPEASIDMIEVNPDMPQMTKLFAPITGDSLNDPRVHLRIEDGFKHFIRDDARPNTYDLVIVDITWTRDGTLTHLFSREFFDKIASSLAPDGIFALWAENGMPGDPVAQSIFATVQASFPYVGARNAVSGYIYIASGNQAILDALPAQDKKFTEDLRMKSAGAPVNTLNHLVLNPLIFGSRSSLYSYRIYQ